MATISEALGRNQSPSDRIAKAQDLMDGIKSSIPFYLSKSLSEYLRCVNAGFAPRHSNQVVRGLLLLHVLYAVARCGIISDRDREYAENTLSWIGTEMGIGQALILADYLRQDASGLRVLKKSQLGLMDVLEGFYLVSAAMMLERC